MIRNVKVTRREAATLQALVDQMNAARRDVSIATAIIAARAGIDASSSSFEGVAGDRVIFSLPDPAPVAFAPEEEAQT